MERIAGLERTGAYNGKRRQGMKTLEKGQQDKVETKKCKIIRRVGG